jgi:hypothetical protein
VRWILGSTYPKGHYRKLKLRQKVTGPWAVYDRETGSYIGMVLPSQFEALVNNKWSVAREWWKYYLED